MIVEKKEDQYNMLDWWKKVVIDNYANFEGRARRSEYWYYVLFNILVIFVFAFLVGISAGISQSSEPPLVFYLLIFPFIIYVFAIIVPSIAVAVRRLHDTGKSGWWYLIGVIPVVSWIGGIILLIFYCEDSQRGRNEYGLNPKGIGNPEDEQQTW